MEQLELTFPLAELIGIVACLISSAFFSGSETALTHFSDTKAMMLIEKEPKRYSILNLWIQSRHRILAALLVGNNLVNILCSILAYRVSFYFFRGYAEAISVFGLTLIILIFAEITPKSLALRYAETLVVPVMRIVWVVDKILYPVSSTLSHIPGLISNREDIESFASEDEIEFHIRRGVDQNVFEEVRQGQLLKSAVDFVDTMVKEVMVPRTDVFGLDQSCPLNEAIDMVIEKGHSRIPVYKKNLDHIQGFLYAKDLLSCMRKGNQETGTASDLIRSSPVFVPETQKINQLLTDMKRQGLHMAIVVDEFGGTSGLVTMEDIIEELVGEIRDEFDLNETMIRKKGEGHYQVDARLSIYDLEDQLDISLPDSGDYETVGGFVIAQLGRIPRPGKIINVGPVEIIVREADEKHISSLEIRTSGKRSGVLEEGKAS
ncbi:MAG: hypothetical protein CSA81_11785 [Acidobacteria bacterium]|nr:MAG: hypothetical protein CSA81_11785 [Acidobacteriota bacterium]